jgi:hypothetical protein
VSAFTSRRREVVRADREALRVALDALLEEELLSRLPQAVARRPTAAIAATA